MAADTRVQTRRNNFRNGQDTRRPPRNRRGGLKATGDDDAGHVCYDAPLPIGRVHIEESRPTMKNEGSRWEQTVPPVASQQPDEVGWRKPGSGRTGPGKCPEATGYRESRLSLRRASAKVVEAAHSKHLAVVPAASWSCSDRSGQSGELPRPASSGHSGDRGIDGPDCYGSQSAGSTGAHKTATTAVLTDSSGSNARSSSSWWDSSGSEEVLPNSSQSISSGSDGSGSGAPDKGVAALPTMTTTLKISNIPSFFTQGSLLSMFEDLMPAMRGRCDFFFSPWDDKIGSGLGYALINFVTSESAIAFFERWQNQHLCGGSKGTKALRVRPAPVQGFRANVLGYVKASTQFFAEARFKPLVRRPCPEDPPSERMVPLDIDMDLLLDESSASGACR